MKNNDKELLEILFNKHLKFFDNEFVRSLLIYYKNQTPLSDADLYPQIYSNKYKLSTEWNSDSIKNNSSLLLFNACSSGNKRLVKYFGIWSQCKLCV